MRQSVNCKWPTIKIIVLYCHPCDILTPYITKADKSKLVLIFVCNHTVIYQYMLAFSDNIKQIPIIAIWYREHTLDYFSIPY